MVFYMKHISAIPEVGCASGQVGKRANMPKVGQVRKLVLPGEHDRELGKKVGKYAQVGGMFIWANKSAQAARLLLDSTFSSIFFFCFWSGVWIYMRTVIII